jgi:hypothetical protein
MTWASSFPSPWELVPEAGGLQQHIVIMLELVRGEKRDVPVRALFDASDQLVGVSLVVAAARLPLAMAGRLILTDVKYP